MFKYVVRDLLHNPRRTLASLVAVTLGVGLFSGVLFFMDGSGATMTERAIAPLALDMQRVIGSPSSGSLRLAQTFAGPVMLAPGEQITIDLTVTDEGTAPANDVVVNDVPPAPLSYVPGTTTLNGRHIPDVAGESALSHGLAGFGMNIGKLEPGANVKISYVASAGTAVADVGLLPLRGTVSSREQAVPTTANAPPTLTMAQLQTRVAAIPGVAAADGLAFVDLPPGSLVSGGATIDHPIRVFAFDPPYLAHYPSIRIVDGRSLPGSALLSAEAARSLGSGPGATVDLRIPGRPARLSVRVGGVADLAGAPALFASRKSTKLEEFLYVPDAIVVPLETFLTEVIPALARAEAAVGTVTKSFPFLELDVLTDRSQLHTDPGAALRQTRWIADAIDRIAPGQDYLIDNISNALAVARDDASVARRMFFFLGFPGLLIAGFLAAYTGSIEAAAQRREMASLRIRGAHLKHLRRIAIYKALVFAGIGSILGVTLGLVSAATILGRAALLDADPWRLLLSGVIAAGTGGVIVALAMYIPAARSVRREISEERREMAVTRAHAWRSLWLDVAVLAAAVIAEVVVVRTGALDVPSGSVYQGVAISVPSRLVLAPLLAWVGGLLLCVRLFIALASRLPNTSPLRFGSVIGGVMRRSVRRRPWSPATGILGLGLVVSFGMALVIFAATYDGAKAADSRFTVGSDIKITPSVVNPRAHRTSYASELMVPGVTPVTPVVFRLENSVLIGSNNQRRTNLAAIDPSTFSRVAPLPEHLSEDGSANAMAAMTSDPRGAMVDAESAADLQIGVGDTVTVVLALGTTRETREPFHVVGVYERFPGFPEGANLVVNIDRYQEATGLRSVDFFLAAVADRSHEGLNRAIAALRSGPGSTDPLRIDSTDTFLDKDQSTLLAVNVNGLMVLDTFYVLLMAAAAIAMFVFGLLLQRRREFVTLRAQGLRSWELRSMVLGEAGLVTICGLVGALLVGSGVASLLTRILRGLFVLQPALTFPIGRIAMLMVLVLTASVSSAVAATEILRYLKPTEILREE